MAVNLRIVFKSEPLQTEMTYSQVSFSNKEERMGQQGDHWLPTGLYNSYWFSESPYSVWLSIHTQSPYSVVELLFLNLVLRHFPPCTRAFPFPQKPTFPHPNSIQNSKATGSSALLLIKADLFIFSPIKSTFEL